MWSRVIEEGLLYVSIADNSIGYIKQRPEEGQWECHMGARRSYRGRIRAIWSVWGV